MNVFSSTLTQRFMSLKHDLGKYIAWQSANVEEEEWWTGSERLTASIQRDLLRTRTSRDGVPQPAWDVYDEWFCALTDEERTQAAPVLGRVAAQVRWMESIAAQISSGEALDDPAIRRRIKDAQREIRDTLRDLVRRARGG